MDIETPLKVFKLTFTNDLDGVEATVVAAGIPATTRLFTELASHLVGWNLKTNGEPVAPTVELLLALDPSFGLRIAGAWLEACADQLGHMLIEDSEPIDPADIPMEDAPEPGI